MSFRADKQRKAKSRAAASSELEKRSQDQSNATPHIPDNRMNAAAQRKLQQSVQSGDAVSQLRVNSEQSILSNDARHIMQESRSSDPLSLQLKSTTFNERPSQLVNETLQREDAASAEMEDADYGYEEDPDDWDADAFSEEEAQEPEAAPAAESVGEALDYEDDPDDWDADAFRESDSDFEESAPDPASSEAAESPEHDSEASSSGGIEPGSELAAWFADEIAAEEGAVENKPKKKRFGALRAGSKNAAKKFGKKSKAGAKKAGKKSKAGAKKGAYKVFDNPLAVKAASGTVAVVVKAMKEIITYAGSKANSGSAKLAQVASWAGLGLNTGALLLALKGLVTARKTRTEIDKQKTEIESEGEQISDEKAERQRLLSDRFKDIVWKVRNKAIDVVQSVIGIANSILALVGAVVIAPIIAAGNLALTTLRMGVMLGDRFKNKKQTKQRQNDARTIAMGVFNGNEDDCKLVIEMGVPSLVSRIATKASEFTKDNQEHKHKGEKIHDAESLTKFAKKLPQGKAEGEETYTFESFVSEIYNGLNKF